MGRSKKDSGSWLMTYGDLVTLLMVFFVVLYTLTPGLDEKKFQQFLIPFQGDRAVLESQSLINPQDLFTSVEQKQAAQIQSLIDFVEDNDIRDQVDIELTPEGIRISLSEAITFNSGSADLIPLAYEIIGDIAQLLKDDIHEVEVQGHTDDVPIGAASRFRSNWDLGAARAVSVVHVLISNSNLEASRFKASSFSEYRPIRENENEESRRRNRRVEIYVRYAELMQSIIHEGELPI